MSNQVESTNPPITGFLQQGLNDGDSSAFIVFDRSYSPRHGDIFQIAHETSDTNLRELVRCVGFLFGGYAANGKVIHQVYLERGQGGTNAVIFPRGAEVERIGSAHPRQSDFEMPLIAPQCTCAKDAFVEEVITIPVLESQVEDTLLAALKFLEDAVKGDREYAVAEAQVALTIVRQLMAKE